MLTSITTTITAEVFKKTESVLSKSGKELGLTIGEVIDRMVFNYTFNEPDIASVALCEQFAIMTSGQTPKEQQETILDLASILIAPIVCKEIGKTEFFEMLSDKIEEKVASFFMK